MRKDKVIWIITGCLAITAVALTVFLFIRKYSNPQPVPPVPTSPPIQQTDQMHQMEQQYPDKKVLTWYMDEFALDGMSKERMIAFNDKLVEKGANFVLLWVPLASAEQYPHELQAYMDGTEQVDLFYSGLLFNNTSPRGEADSYMRSYQNDWLMPLDDIIPESLKNAFDSIYWDTLRINGKIYGFSTSPFYGRTNELLVSNGINTSSGIDANGIMKDLKSLTLLLDAQDVEYPIEFLSSLSTICCYLGYNWIESVVAMDTSGLAFNLLEDPAFIEYLETIRWFMEEGYVNPDPKSSYFTAPFILNDGYGAGFSLILGYQTHKLGNVSAISTNTVIGIAKKSKYPEEALTLLSWLVTDRELADLLVFGTEGEHYQVQDGRITGQTNTFLRWYTGLYQYTTPLLTEPLDKAELIRECNQQALLTSTTGFHFDNRGYVDTIDAIREKIQNYMNPTVTEVVTNEAGDEISRSTYIATHGILTGHDPDYKEKLTKLNNDVKAAGMYELVAEVNRQYVEWYAQYGRK